MSVMKRATVFLLVLAGLQMTGSLPAARAGSYVYSESQRTIRVCNLLLSGSGNAGYLPAQWNAGVFSVLNNRLDTKPAGWNFVNPLSPTVVTPEIKARYSSTMPLTAGQWVTKDMPCYWDVCLDEVTLSRLLQFDLVYLAIPAGRTVSFQPRERELLRKLVDSGAQLWIDWGGSGAAPFSASVCGKFFIASANFQTAGSRMPAGVGSRHHALLSYPFWLEQQEINSLGLPYAHGVVSDGSGHDPFPQVFVPVVRNGSGCPVVAAGSYGSGHVIMTSNDIGGDIVRPNFAAVSNPMFAASEDLKFAYNVAAWGSNYVTTYKDPAHSSASSQGPGAPLVQRWQYGGAGGTAGAAAVIYKGLVLFSDNAGKLHCFDGVPQEDLDGDGNPDDGEQDLSLGAPYDQIWQLSMGNGASGPTVCTWPGGPPFPAGTDVALVTNASGKVVGVPLTNPGGAAALPSFDLGSLSAAGSPTYHNGVVYAMDSEGNLCCYDPHPPSGPQEVWKVPQLPPGMTFGFDPRPSSPSVGWVQDPGTKAVDLMAYWLAGTNASTSGGTPSDRLVSAIFGVRNEPLTRLPGNLAANRYNNARNFLDPGSALWALTPDATDPEKYDCAEITATASSLPGQWQLPAALPSGVTAATPIYADYDMLRALPSNIGQNLRPRTVYTPKPDITGGGTPDWTTSGGSSTAALGPDGTVYLTGDRSNVSQLYAIQEFGPRFNLLAGQASVPQQSMDWTVYLGKVVDYNSGITYFPAIDYELDTVTNGSGVGLEAFDVSGPPAVTDDAVYVTAKGRDTLGNQCIVLFCFTRKWNFQVRLGDDVNFYDTAGNLLPVKVWQPNPFASGATNSPIQDAASIRSSAIDYDRRTITFDNFDNTNFQIGNGPGVISKWPVVAGVPVTVFVGGVAVPSNSDSMRNLRWYFVAYTRDTDCSKPLVPADRATGDVSPPTVLGDYVYFGTSQGFIYAVRTDVTPHRGKQVFGREPNYMAAHRCNPSVNPDAPSWADQKKWVAWQDKEASKAIITPLAGAGGLLAVVSDGGLAVYDSPATLIADNNRLLEVDAGSSIVWSLDGTVEPDFHRSDPNTVTAFSVKKTAFSRPSIVRNVEGNNMVVCDSGNNRIVRVDRGGTALREIRDFEDPLGLLPAGASRALSGPSDVRTWTSVEPDPILPSHPAAYVYHYLVVDRGNFRVLDLLVRYDQSGTPLPAEPGATLTPADRPPAVLNWISTSGGAGRLLRYETAQLVPGDYEKGDYYVLCAVSNYTVEDPSATAPAAALPDAPGGGIVKLDYGVRSSKGAWTYHPGRIVGATTSVADSGVNRPLANPRFFERFFEGKGGYHDIICDAAGVWELDDTAAVVWRLTSNRYKSDLGRGVPLRAASAKVLPNGRMLIANEFTGLGVSGNAFHGEVFEVDRKNASGAFADPTAITWSSPEVVPDGSGGVKQQITGSYLIEQPTFADRR